MAEAAWASRYAVPWAEVVLRALRTPYPWISGHMSLAGDDVDVTPQRLHPAFHGSYDWHSSVHMQWSGVRLLADHGAALPTQLADQLRDELGGRLTEKHCAAEAAYLRERPHFERPYGWAWAAMLAAELRRVEVADAVASAASWCRAMTRVTDAVADHLVTWLPRQAYPVRHGVHANTAFGLLLCREAFSGLGRDDVVTAIDRRAREWFLADRDAPVHWEPSGEDFLSPSLCEAALMCRVLPESTYAEWLGAFLPGLGREGDPLLAQPEVRDATEGKMVHLYGLSLSRAWLLRLLAPSVTDPTARDRMLSGAETLATSVDDVIVSGDFVSTHWLVSFGLLAHAGLSR